MFTNWLLDFNLLINFIYGNRSFVLEEELREIMFYEELNNAQKLELRRIYSKYKRNNFFVKISKNADISSNIYSQSGFIDCMEAVEAVKEYSDFIIELKKNKLMR